MSLPLIARTQIARFIAVNERVIVRLTRFLSPDLYADPPIFEQLSVRWGSCHRGEPDSFRELGSLEDALKDVAPIPMLVAAATASPLTFAEMVASAHELGRVIAVGSVARLALGDSPEARRFCAIDVKDDALTFHVLQPMELFGPGQRAPGVYAVSYSLTALRLARDELVKAHPAARRP